MEENGVRAAAIQTETRPVALELENLFRLHNDQVFRTAFRITGSYVDSEDVLQTVFMRLATQREGLDLSPSPAGYLHRAAVNASLDIIRSRGRAGAVSIDDPRHGEVESLEMSPEERQARRERSDLVRRAIAGLNPRASEVVALKYIEGHSNAEIAEILGMSRMVVGVILHRSRAKLRKELSEYTGGMR